MSNPKKIFQPKDLPVRKSHSQVVTVTGGTLVFIGGDYSDVVKTTTFTTDAQYFIYVDPSIYQIHIILANNVFAVESTLRRRLFICGFAQLSKRDSG